MQNNNLQNLKSFSPIVYKKGRQSYLFAKQNNRLYRIVFSFSKPSMLVLTPEKIEPMTPEDVLLILSNYMGDNPAVEEKISYLSTLYKTFKENYIKNNSLNPQELYTKTCEIILNHPDFLTSYKEENTPSSSLQQKSLSHEEKTTPLPSAEKKTIQVYDFITPKQKIKKSKEEILPAFKKVQTQNNKTPSNEDKNGMITRTYEGKTFQISLTEPYSFYIVNEDKKTILSIEDFYIFFKHYQNEPQVTDKDAFLLEKLYFETTTSHKKTKYKPSKKYPSKYAIHVSYSHPKEEKKHPNLIDSQKVETQSIPVSTPIQAKTSVIEPTLEATPIQVKTKVIEPALEATPIQAKTRVIEPTLEATPIQAKTRVIEPALEPITGKLLMQKIISSIKKTPQKATPLQLFLGEDSTSTNFDIQIKIQHLKHAIKCNALSLKNQQSYQFDLGPEISTDGFLHFFSKGVHYILSLDEDKPCLIKKYLSSNIQLPIPLGMCKEILRKISYTNPSLLSEIEKAIEPIYTKIIAQQQSRYRSKNYPSFSQIEELRILESRFEKKELPQIILPVAINKNTIIAKYNHTYLKLCIKNNTPSFEAFENDVTRPMKLAEFTQLISDIQKTNTYRLVFNNKLTWVKKAFQKQMPSHQEDEKQSELKNENIPQFNLFPSFEQVTFGKSKNSEIQPVILSDRSIYARLSNIDYRIYFSPKYQFIAYEESLKRQLYQEELALILNKLEQTYTDAFLNHIGLKRHLSSLNKAPAPTQESNPKIEKEENLDTEQQNLEFELKSFLAPKKTVEDNLSIFLEIDAQPSDFKTYLKILELKDKLSHKNKGNSSTLSSMKTLLFYANNDHIYQKEDELIYNICLVRGKEYFKRYSLGQKGASLLSLKRTLQILTDATKENPTLQNKIKKIVPSIYKRYLEEKPTYSPTHTLPSISQVIEKQKLLNELNGEKESDILPVLTFNNQIFAKLLGVYYKIHLDDNTPYALAFENGQVRDMLVHEIQKIRSLYQKHHANLFYKNKIIIQSFDQLIQQENEKEQQTKNQTSLRKKEEKTVIPPLEKNDVTQENQMTPSRRNTPRLIVKKKLTTKHKKPIPVKKELLDTVEQNEQYQLEPFYKMLQTDNTSSPNLLDQIQAPLCFKLHLPDKYREHQTVAKFYHPNKQLPNFNYFFQTLLLLQHIKFQNKKIQYADILNFNFNPIVCSNNVLYFKKGFILSAISLDKEYPYFKIRDLREKTSQRLSWEDTVNIIQYWLGRDERSERLLKRLKPLYHQNNDKMPPKALPSFQEVFAYHYYKAVLAYLKNPREGMDTKIPATVLHGKQILFRQGDVFYKIEAGKIIKFEKNVFGQLYLINPHEFNSFLKSATDEHTITPQISSTLRQIYKDEIEPLFYGKIHQNIPIEKRNILISNKNKYVIQKIKSENARENT